jgi:hypothetical protein
MLFGQRLIFFVPTNQYQLTANFSLPTFSLIINLMKKILHVCVAVILIVAVPDPVFAQGVGIGTQNPSPSARLDIQSTNSGILIPRLSSVQRKAIANPEMV